MLPAVIADSNDGNAFEEGYFLSSAGGIRFRTTEDAAPGNSDCVVAADTYGVTVFTDRQGAQEAGATSPQPGCSPWLKN
jgi:hypothetical protein